MFAVKRGNTAIELGCFSRSFDVYQIGYDYTDYGKWKPFGLNECECIMSDLKQSINRMEESVRGLQKQITDIGQFNNALEDKLEAIDRLNAEIAEYREMISDKQTAYGWYWSISEIIDNQSLFNDGGAEMYIGIEAALSDLTKPTDMADKDRTETKPNDSAVNGNSTEPELTEITVTY